MDRRRLLRGAFGVGLAAVTTKLWVPPVSTALAEPERTVFVPPANGWPEWGDESALGYLRRFEGVVSDHDYRLLPGDYDPELPHTVETTYDVEVLGDLPFIVQPGDTVKVIMGEQTGYMVVESLDWTSYEDRMATTRLRGLGVESYLPIKMSPVGSLVPDRASITRSLKPLWPYRAGPTEAKYWA